jgi:hypothetical protein
MAADDQSIGEAANQYVTAPDVITPLETGVDPGGEEGASTMTFTSRPATPDERFRRALATPGLSGRAVPKLIDALSRYGQMAEDNSPLVMKDNPYPGVSIVTSRSGRGGMHVVEDPNAGGMAEALKPTYTEDPITGSRTLLYGKTAQSTGFNPTKAQPQILKAAQDEEGNAIPGYYIDGQGKLHDTRSALQKSLGTSTSAPAGGQALPLPKDKGKLLKGKVYQTSRGLATWDGANFVKQ